MRKELIITVAGTSSRFSESLGRETLKCIYYEKSPQESLLYRMISDTKADRYIVVGGYKFEELARFVNENFSNFDKEITLVSNSHFSDYGSGYSLYLGIEEAIKTNPDEVVFAEGDLFLDKDNFYDVFDSDSSIITINPEPITAKKAVAVYVDEKERLKYIYDTGHSLLEIKEPFLAVYNSGQVWKFKDIDKLRKICKSLTESEMKGTNLVVIQKYFGDLEPNEYKIVSFKEWINCNTVFDYRKAMEFK